MIDQNTTENVPEIVFNKESLDLIDTITRKWAVMSQFEQDLENYELRKQQYEQ
jgi:hypothetical protein